MNRFLSRRLFALVLANWASGKTLNVQNGGDVIFVADYSIPSAATINITAQAGTSTKA